MSAHTIPVLHKAVALLREVTVGGETTTKALALRTGTPQSTAYRILQTLIAEDWVRASSGGRHELSLGLIPLLQPLVRHELLVETSRPLLDELSILTGLTAKLSVRQGDRAVALLRAESPLETSVSVRVGSAFHLALGSSGAVLLSDLEPAARRLLLDQAPAECWQNQTPAQIETRIADCRRLGYCGDYGGYQPVVHALSAPVRDRAGAVVGAFTLVGFAHDFEGRRLANLARHLLAAVAACGRAIQGVSPAPASA